jgi:hypothetical protein
VCSSSTCSRPLIKVGDIHGEFVVSGQNMLNNGFLQVVVLIRRNFRHDEMDQPNPTPLGTPRVPCLGKPPASSAQLREVSTATLARLATTTSTSRHQNINCNSKWYGYP